MIVALTIAVVVQGIVLIVLKRELDKKASIYGDYSYKSTDKLNDRVNDLRRIVADIKYTVNNLSEIKAQKAQELIDQANIVIKDL